MANAKKTFPVTYVESYYAAAALVCCGFDCQIYYNDDTYEEPTYYVFVKTPAAMKALNLYKQGKLRVDAWRYAKELRDMSSRQWELARRYQEFAKS